MNKELDAVTLGADICPHTLTELAADIQELANTYGDAPIMIEAGTVIIYEKPKKPKAIVFDSDEVLLNWPKGFRDYHNKYYKTRVDTLDYHDTIDNLMGVPMDVLEPRMRDFNRDSWEFGCLEPMQHATTAIDYIMDHNRKNPDDQIDIIVVTKCGTQQHIQNMRIANLNNVFGGVFEKIYCLNIHDSKVGHLKMINEQYDVLMFVDDYFKNVEEVAAETTVPCYALRAAHNKHKEFPDGTIGCEGWEDLFAKMTTVIREAE